MSDIIKDKKGDDAVQTLPSKDKWGEIYRAWKKSSMSKARFCKERGLVVDHFYYWSRRFETQNRVSSPSGFIPIVSPKAKVDEEKLILLELQLPNRKRSINPIF
jgi:hypothetical protein